MKAKLIRITTVPISLKVLLRQQLKFMSGHFEVLAVSSPGNVLDEVSRAEGVRTAPVAMTRSITPVNDMKALWQLYRLFKKEHPAIVHTHTPKAGLLGMMAARLAGVPVRLHTVAGLPLMENKGLRRKILEWAERLTYTCATRVYPNSGNLADFLVKHRLCSGQKLQVLGNGSSNGIDTRYFQVDGQLLDTARSLREKAAIGPDAFVFVFIGRLVKDKGIQELVTAFTRLREKHTRLKLLLVGPYEHDLDPLPAHTLRAIAADKDIIQVDFQQDIRPWLLMSQVLVFPSYREGFPNVPMQAGCFHLPVIASNINGCNEIIQPEHNGLLIPVKDPAALEAAMERLYTDQPLYDRLKAQARQAILERYDQQYFWDLLLQEYRHQLHQHALLS